MYLYKNTVTPKNTAAKITAISCIICGMFLWIVSAYAPIPSVFQSFAVVLFATAIYIASAFLLRIYSYEIAYNYKENETEDASLHDLIIYERKNNKFVKVCHIEISDVILVREVNPKNIKDVKAQRKNMKRYTYNTQFAASQKIEIVANIEGEELSVLTYFDPELLNALQHIINTVK